MGSFDYTCCVSGLPISDGTPIRYLLLTENPYNSPAEHTCYIDDRWALRTFPLRAEYDDYGSVQIVQEGLLRDIWLEGFKRDLVERGTGDNSCHDVPVRKDMTFEQMLTAIWEGRVLVACKQPETSLPVEPSRPIHKGIPTIQRVRKILRKAGLKLSDGMLADGCVVDLQKPGFVRVRIEQERNNFAPFADLQQLFKPYFATMITTGTGAYPAAAELWLAPKPLPGPNATTIASIDATRKPDSTSPKL